MEENHRFANENLQFDDQRTNHYAYPTRQQIRKILADLGRLDLIEQSDSEPDFLLYDLLIPYREDQLYYDDGGDRKFVKGFLRHQEQFICLDKFTKHHRFKNDKSCYVFKGVVGRAGRTTVDQVTVGPSDSLSETTTSVYARKVVDKPSALTKASERNDRIRDFECEV